MPHAPGTFTLCACMCIFKWPRVHLIFGISCGWGQLHLFLLSPRPAFSQYAHAHVPSPPTTHRLPPATPSLQCVIFSVFPSCLEAVKERLGPQGFNFRTIESRQSQKARAKAIDDFVHDPPTTIFLLSATVASVGLTLVAANQVIFMEPNLNVAQELQAVGRVLRMGQTKDVAVSRLIMKDSVEGSIRAFIDG